MADRFRSRPPLVKLSDELFRLRGRLKALYKDAIALPEFSDLDVTVLNAVVEAQRAPTVPEIGRSLGLPRQSVQRSADVLMARGLLTRASNPHHKRAALLLPTEAGTSLKLQLDRRCQAQVDAVLPDLDTALVDRIVADLNDLRVTIEKRMRAAEQCEDDLAS